MSDREILERNIRLAFEVAQTAANDPRAAKELADAARGGGLVLADPTDPELSLSNQQLVETLRARGESVAFVEVNKSATILPSRD